MQNENITGHFIAANLALENSKKWKQNKFVIELTSVMEFMLIEMGDSVAMRK